jgi:hypothetical protein
VESVAGTSPIRTTFQILVGGTYMKVDPTKISCERVDWIQLDQSRVQWRALISIKEEEFLIS